MASLEDAAKGFAADLNALLTSVLPGTIPEFIAVAAPRKVGDQQRVSVSLAESVDIRLTIGHEHWLDLVASYQCHWDHATSFLAVRNATLSVTPADKGAPLFRYEFIADMQDALPCAHLHVHAHRDEFLLALLQGVRGKSKTRQGKARRALGKKPKLSDVHFPLGGPRMRPSLEDVLQMLITEFDIDVLPGATEALDSSRAEWRRKQTAAAVRDAPAEAVRVLRDLGYEVKDPPDGPRPERTGNLARL